MNRIHGVLLSLLVASSPLWASDCSRLKNLKLENTEITLAESVTTGALQIPGEAPMSGLPAMCRVAGILRPTSDSEIHFEVWMPAKGWNERLLGVGNGGFAGAIGYRQFTGYLKRGFAVAGSDAGHRAEGTDATWAYGHPEKIKDFGWRAVHLTAERGKQVIAAYYGQPQDHAYFDSCSDGGREALMEAQRFPADYDGILAGAPANAWSTMLAAGIGSMQSLMNDPHAYISDLKLPAIQKAALDGCDAQDGVKDGVIGNPEKCRFDPEALLCKAGENSDCLTRPQLETLKSLYAGANDSQGKTIFPGATPGDETSWREWVVGEDPGASLSARFVQNYFRYMVADDPKANPLTANVDETVQQSQKKMAADLDSTNPDLSAFAGRGGKLILYHGWNDPAISPWNTIAYYKQVQQTMGEPKVDSFARLYMVPGMEHCAGGPGAAAFGQLGIAPTAGPANGLFDALQDWVEKGQPDGAVIASKSIPGPGGSMKTVMTRPLCAYPSVAEYKGSGNTSDAANFACTKP